MPLLWRFVACAIDAPLGHTDYRALADCDNDPDNPEDFNTGRGLKAAEPGGAEALAVETFGLPGGDLRGAGQDLGQQVQQLGAFAR